MTGNDLNRAQSHLILVAVFMEQLFFSPILQLRKQKPRKEVTLPILHSRKVADLGFKCESKAGLLTTNGIALRAFCYFLRSPAFSSPMGLLTATDRLPSQALSLRKSPGQNGDQVSQAFELDFFFLPRGSPSKPPPGSSLLRKEGRRAGHPALLVPGLRLQTGTPAPGAKVPGAPTTTTALPAASLEADP